jgi:transcriptional regulator with XRE-family HTH domain
MSVVVALDWSPLRKRRRSMDVTQAQVGAMAGVSASMISHVEHSRRGLTALQAVQISQGMGTPWYDLCRTITEKAR